MNLYDIWTALSAEVRHVFSDSTVMLIFFIAPLLYPLIFCYMYKTENAENLPVAVVDDSHSSLSRQFIRMCDASPDVRVAFYAQDMDEAKSLVSRQLVKGVYYFPPDFDIQVNRMEQGTVSVYCDMSLMLTYKAIFQTAQTVSMEMGSQITTRLGGHYTHREEVVSARPLDYDDVPLFNPQGGYGSSVLPAVLMLILQQTLVLGIGLSAGTARDENKFRHLIPVNAPHYERTFPIVLGKFMCYFMIYAVMGAWLVAGIPRIFHFPQLATWFSLLMFMIPYIIACIFFGMMVSCMVKYRENVMLLIVFVSIPLLFMSGVSWPQSNIPGMWQGVSWLFPSTFGIRGYIRLNSMGATLNDVQFEYWILWLQAVVYFILACLVYRFQYFIAKRDAKKYGN
jgi:ABC-2 type transport system permease protein